MNNMIFVICIINIQIEFFRVSLSGCPGQNMLPGMLGRHATPFWNPHGMPRKHVMRDVPLRAPYASNAQKSVSMPKIVILSVTKTLQPHFIYTLTLYSPTLNHFSPPSTLQPLFVPTLTLFSHTLTPSCPTLTPFGPI